MNNDHYICKCGAYVPLYTEPSAINFSPPHVCHALNCPCQQCKTDPIKQQRLRDMQAAQRSAEPQEESHE